MSIMSIPMLLAPIAGPILGGWLIDTASWKWIFFINVPIGLPRWPWRRSCSRKTTRGLGNLDVVGLLLLSPGLAIFLFGVSSIPRCGTVADRCVLIPAAIGLAFIAAFVVHACIAPITHSSICGFFKIG